MNYSSLKLVFVAVASLVLLAQKSYANGAGNGGGYVCPPTAQCMSLYQAGLQIAREKDDVQYLLPVELLNEVEKVLDLLPFTLTLKKDIKSRVMGNSRTYVPLDVVDQRKFETIRKQYAGVITKYSKVNPAYFRLLAFSDPYKLTYAAFGTPEFDDYKTYLTKEFRDLDKTNPTNGRRIQALTLIHEANVRGRGPNILTTALAFDGEIERLLDNSQLVVAVDYDLIGFYRLTVTLGYFSNIPVLINLTAADGGGPTSAASFYNEASAIELMRRYRGKPITVGELTEHTTSYPKISYEKLLGLARFNPELIKVLDGKRIRITINEDIILTKDRQDMLDNICRTRNMSNDPSDSLLITNSDFNETILGGPLLGALTCSGGARLNMVAVQ